MFKNTSYFLGKLCLGVITFTLFNFQPVLAAEQIILPISALKFTLPISDLEIYAKEGKIQGEFAQYAKHASPEKLMKLRLLLQAKIAVKPFAISQFLYSKFGETLLEYTGKGIQTESGQNGFKAMRAAIILAAAEPEGLTFLNLLRQFPSDSVRIDSERSLDLLQQFGELMEQTTEAMQKITAESELEITTGVPVDFSQLTDLRKPGPFTWQQQTISLNDSQRNRQFLADIYLPNSQQNQAMPVVVISHGLGSNRTDFKQLAAHLASHGFVVAIPDHPGSDSKQRQALLIGAAREFVEPAEFINRPLDITYLLDELERKNQSNPVYKGKLNLNQVGAIGHSIGGHTVLALAGAPINWEQLQKDCHPTPDSLNISLPVQCAALELTPENRDFRDNRIKGIMAFNPLQRTILGQRSLQKINIPVTILAGSDDTVTPAILEQIEPFSWLNNPNKYLALIEKGTHIYNPGEAGGDAVPIPAELFGPDPALARSYLNYLSLAFLQTHIANQPEFSPYLTAAYAKHISKEPLKLLLINKL